MGSPAAGVPARRAGSIGVLVLCALAACGDESADPTTGETFHAASGTVITSNGGYRVTVSVAPRVVGAPPPPCARDVRPGSTALRVVMTVANESPDRPVPFPPLRVELVGTGGAPTEVRMQDSSGSCTFTPREPAIEAAGSASFTGATPAIADTTPPGGAGTVQAGLSESGFTVSVPVP